MTASDQSDIPISLESVRSLGNARAMVLIAGLSVAIVVFLFWLLYFRSAASHQSDLIGALPAFNAGFNSLSTVFLLAGYAAVRRRRLVLHMKLMFAALASSTLFFISYVVYHAYHGNTKFLAAGPVRPLYFFVLITHIVLSAIVVPMILTSLYLSLSGRLAAHRRVSRWTLPVWLY